MSYDKIACGLRIWLAHHLESYIIILNGQAHKLEIG